MCSFSDLGLTPVKGQKLIDDIILMEVCILVASQNDNKMYFELDSLGAKYIL